MNILFPQVNAPFTIRDDKINQIIIESPVDLYILITELSSQISKNDGDIILSDGNKLLDISKIVDLTTDYFPFEVNKKSLVSKLYTIMKEDAINESTYETNEIISRVSKYLVDISNDHDYNIEFEQLDVVALFKACNVRFCDDAESLEEKVVNYCKNTITMLGDKVFVFVSLRNYLSDKSFEYFKKMVIDNKLKVILIEAVERPKKELENTLIVDMDRCLI